MLLDIGSGEIIAIVVLAAVLLGPEKIPPLAKKVGRVLGFLRQVANSATDQIKAELGPEYADLTLSDLKPKNLVQKILPDDVQDEMTTLRAELAAMRTEVTKLQTETAADVQATVEVARTAATMPGWNTAGGKSLYDSLAELTGYAQRSQVVEHSDIVTTESAESPESAESAETASMEDPATGSHH